MPQPYYPMMYMIPPDINYTFEDLVKLIQDMPPRNRQIQINMEKRIIRISKVEFSWLASENEDEDESLVWSYYLAWEDAPHVITESEEIARFFGEGLPNRERIASCHRRIIGRGDSNMGMNLGFDLFVDLYEVIDKHLDGCYRFDSLEQKVVDAGG